MEKESQEPPKGLVDLAQVAISNRCIYCQSQTIVKRGKRKKKLEEVQLYLCKACGRTFTGQTVKGKKFPLRLILEGVSLYHLGFSFAESARRMEQEFGLPVDPGTLARWVEQLSDICTYSRMREYGLKLYSPHQVIQSFVMRHQQKYTFRYHRAKMALLLQEYQHARFAPLRELLDIVVDECPHELFKTGPNLGIIKRAKEQKRSSELKGVFDMSGVRIAEKVNYAVHLAQLALQAVGDNKLRHEALQRFMIACDSVTVATELPVYFEEDDALHMRQELGFDIPAAIDGLVTGHIDFVQLRNRSVHILDYKPEAAKQYPVDQLTLYALALSRLTGLRLFDMRCAWFDERRYYEFFPLHVVHKKRRR